MSNSLIDLLNEKQLKYRTLGNVEQGQLVILERGARMLAMFPAKEIESPLWLDSSALEQGDWNVGGDRTWISPEIPLFQDEAGAYSIPSALDPGSYAFKNSENTDTDQAVELEMSFTLHHALAVESISMKLHKAFHPATNPLLMNDASLHAPIQKLQYVGYVCKTRLIVLPRQGELRHNALHCSLWSIMQVPPGGVVLIPTLGTSQPMDMLEGEVKLPDCYKTFKDHLRVAYQGSVMFKLSLTALQSTGRFGYLHQSAGDNASLLIRQFQVNPSGFYPDYPMAQPDYRSSCMQFYYDGGQLGGFGELEYHTPAISLGAHEQRIEDISQVWHYNGPIEEIRKVAKVMLGIDL